MLSSVAKDTGTWLIGGSVPERQDGEDKLWNTATVWDPHGRLSPVLQAGRRTKLIRLGLLGRVRPGNLVAKHRKIHLYDVNIPGGINFQVRHI